MPEKNGIDLAADLAAFPSDVIFVTSHTGFAIKAFEACALDYLVKPIYAEKLRGLRRAVCVSQRPPCRAWQGLDRYRRKRAGKRAL